jgi:hypothetical protein
MPNLYGTSGTLAPALLELTFYEKNQRKSAKSAGENILVDGTRMTQIWRINADLI